MNRDRDIKEIVTQLQRLQLQQATLISRLGSISESEARENDNTAREFVVGDRVRIKNPSLFQATIGKIVRIGTRITVQASNGKKIVRAPKNLILEEDE